MSALDQVLEICDPDPCARHAPRLHRLLDGELAAAESRPLRRHLRRCEGCRMHLRLLELEEQTVREIAAPSTGRLVELWSDRLRTKMVAAVAQEAGDGLLSELRGVGTGAARYLAPLSGWVGMPPPRAPRDAIELVAAFRALLGDGWPPLDEARSILAAHGRQPRPPGPPHASGSGASTSSRSTTVSPAERRTR